MAQRILGVLGGEDMGIELVRAWCASAQVIYAADSGADRVLATGYQPILVGDLDSFQSGYAMVDLRVEERPDQEYTDCDKLLQLVREDGHDSVTLCSVEGDLLDHLLAGLSSAVASGLNVRFALRRGIGVLVRSGVAVSLPTIVGRRASLIPLTTCHCDLLEGVRWPLHDARLEFGAAVSVSNESTAGDVTVRLSEGTALLFVEFPPEEMPIW